MEFLYCCLSYILGAGTVIFSFKLFNGQDRPTEPTNDSEPLEEEIDTSEAEWREQWQSMMDYDPLHPQKKKGGDE